MHDVKLSMCRCISAHTHICEKWLKFKLGWTQGAPAPRQEFLKERADYIDLAHIIPSTFVEKTFSFMGESVGQSPSVRVTV